MVLIFDSRQLVRKNMVTNLNWCTMVFTLDNTFARTTTLLETSNPVSRSGKVLMDYNDKTRMKLLSTVVELIPIV